MLGKLELLTQAGHEAVEEWFTVVGDDVLGTPYRYIMCVLIKSMTFSFFTYLSGIAYAYLEK